MILAHATPRELDLNEDRLTSAYRLLEEWTTGPERPVPGGALLVGRRGKTIEPKFFGRQGPEATAEPIRRDGMFLLASISKPFTYMAGLMLVERGLLNLNDPVMRYLPDFAAHHKEETLVNQLFTHTSGMPDMLENNAALRQGHAPLSRFIQHAIRDTVPLFPPGTKHSYQSMGTLVVAELVQQLSGLSIAAFLKREIFDRLGLRSTGLGSSGFDRKRLVRVQTPEYQQRSDFGWNSQYWQELGAPWGGMFSTPEELAVLCQVMLSGGAWNGERILSPGTVQMMTTNRLNDYPLLPEPIRRTQPWGLGWRMNHTGTPGSWSDLLDRQVFGHTGATGTMVWMDRQREGFAVLLTSAIRANAPWRLVQLSNCLAAAFE